MHSGSFSSPKVCWCLTSAAHLKLLWALWLTWSCAQRYISCTLPARKPTQNFRRRGVNSGGVRQWAGGTNRSLIYSALSQKSTNKNKQELCHCRQHMWCGVTTHPREPWRGSPRFLSPALLLWEHYQQGEQCQSSETILLTVSVFRTQTLWL